MEIYKSELVVLSIKVKGEKSTHFLLYPTNQWLSLALNNLSSAAQPNNHSLPLHPAQLLLCSTKEWLPLTLHHSFPAYPNNHSLSPYRFTPNPTQFFLYSTNHTTPHTTQFLLCLTKQPLSLPQQPHPSPYIVPPLSHKPMTPPHPT